jgi:disulfide bond formation protein DsbB
MRGMKHAHSIAEARSTASRFVTLFALLALFLQSFALQTHIHRLAPAQPAGIEQGVQAPAQAPLKAQDPLDQAGCRLCQEIAHSGFFVGPDAASFSMVPAVAAASFFLVSLAVAATAPPFDWQSRGPPRI